MISMEFLFLFSYLLCFYLLRIHFFLPVVTHLCILQILLRIDLFSHYLKIFSSEVIHLRLFRTIFMNISTSNKHLLNSSGNICKLIYSKDNHFQFLRPSIYRVEFIFLRRIHLQFRSNGDVCTKRCPQTYEQM